MTRLLTFTTAALIAMAPNVLGDPYWIGYAGNDFPENEGWWHIWGPEPAERWIENGALVIDSLHDTHIADFYEMRLNGNLDPAEGEMFLLEWRLKIDEVIGIYDVTVGVASDESWVVGFELNEDTIFSAFEFGVSAPFAPGEFHEFQLRSCDMRAYELYIDRQLAIAGSFVHRSQDSRINWGDGVQGAASLSRWDYMRFGVVPEPATVVPLGTVLLFGVSRSRGKAVSAQR